MLAPRIGRTRDGEALLFAVKACHGQRTCPRCRTGNFGVFAHAGRPLPSFPRRRESSNQPCISRISIQERGGASSWERGHLARMNNRGPSAGRPLRAFGPGGQDARAPRKRPFRCAGPLSCLRGGPAPDHERLGDSACAPDANESTTIDGSIYTWGFLRLVDFSRQGSEGVGGLRFPLPARPPRDPGSPSRRPDRTARSSADTAQSRRRTDTDAGGADIAFDSRSPHPA